MEADFYRSSPMCAIVSNNFDNISVQRSIPKWSVDFWSKLREIWAIACWLMPMGRLQKVSEKFRLKVNGTDDFSGRFSGKFQDQGNVWKGSPVFPDGMFQTEIRVPYFFKAMFGTSAFQIFVPFLRWVELICSNGKRDSGTKFTSPEFCITFVQTVNRPVCPCK